LLVDMAHSNLSDCIFSLSLLWFQIRVKPYETVSFLSTVVRKRLLQISFCGSLFSKLAAEKETASGSSAMPSPDLSVRRASVILFLEESDRLEVMLALIGFRHGHIVAEQLF